MRGLDSVQGGLRSLEATNQPTTVDAAAREAQLAAGRPWQMLGEQVQGASLLLGAAKQFAPGMSPGGAIQSAMGLGKV